MIQEKCSCSNEEKLAYQKYCHDRGVEYIQCRIEQKQRLMKRMAEDYRRKIKGIKSFIKHCRSKIKNVPTKHYLHWCEKTKEITEKRKL